MEAEETNNLPLSEKIKEKNNETLHSIPDIKDIVENKEKKLKHFLLNNFLSDTIIVNPTTKKEYPCHKVIICSGSKYFYNNFLHSESEHVDKNMSEENKIKIEMKENKFIFELPIHISPKMSSSDEDSVIGIILKFLYHNQKIKKIEKEITSKNIFPILSLAHCLSIPKLSKNLGKLIKDKFLTESNCVRVLNEALIFENDNLQKECLNVVRNNFDKISKNHDEFQRILDLPVEDFLNIISSDDLVVNTEKEICDMVMNYIKTRRDINILDGKNVEEKNNFEVENKRYDDNKNFENQEKKENNNPEPENNNPQTDNNNAQQENIENKENTSPPKKNYNETWKSHIGDLKNKFLKKPLKKEEERKIVECIRFSFLSHSELLSLSIEPLMADHRDLILEGLSIRLNTYEKGEDKLPLKINITTRKYIQKLTSTSTSAENPNINNNPNPQNVKSINNNINISISEDFVNQKQNTPLPKNNLSYSNPKPQNNKFINQGLSNNPTSIYQSMNVKLPNSSINTYPPSISQDFTYDYDFDENGVFFYLGTMGKTATFRNPHEIGQIKIFSSSLGKGRLSDLVSREIVNLRTLNEPFSFFGVDLGEDRFLSPTCYSVKNRNSSSHVMLCWVLEASNDKINFEVLDTRLFSSNDPKINQQMEKERSLLKSPLCTSTWGIDPKIKENFPNGFRYFILKQIDKNSSGGYNLAISGFEIYGRGFGRWTFK